jgi:hypothetical protein
MCEIKIYKGSIDEVIEKLKEDIRNGKEKEN